MAGSEQDEIDKIMSEIEELQKDLAPSEVSATGVTAEAEENILTEMQRLAPSDPAITTDLSTDGPAASLEDTLGDLKSERVDGGILDDMGQESDFEATVAAETATLAKVVKVEEKMAPNFQNEKEGGSDGTLSLTLTGNMTLKLKYDFEGQEVTISFGDQALRVQMTDGTEFKIPVIRNSGAVNNVKPFKKVG